MASILDIVQQNLGADQIAQIGQQLGMDPAATQQAVSAALPAMVGGMSSVAQQPGGASAIQEILGSQGGGLLGGLGSILGGLSGGGGLGGGILGSILGHHETAVQDGVEQATGLGSDKTRQLLMMLAPIVMGALARRVMNHGAAATDPGQLSDVLQQDAIQAHQQAQEHSPHMGGLLGKLLGMAESPEMRNR